MSQILAHRVVDCPCVTTERVFLLITVGSWQVLFLLFEDLFDMDLLHSRTWDTERVRECLHLRAELVHCVGRIDFSYATLVLFEFFVAESVLSDAKSSSLAFLVSEPFFNFVTESVGCWLWLREAWSLAKGELLLRGWVVDDSFLADWMRHILA